MKQSTFKLRQNPKKPSKKRLLLLIVAGVIALAIAGFVGYKYMNKPEADKNATDPTITSAKDKDAQEENNSDTAKNESSTTVTAQQVPVSQDMSLSGAVFSQADGMVTSSVLINGSTGTGKCVFTFTATDSMPVVAESTSIAQSSQQKCSTNISEVRFDKTGGWNLNITFFQNNQKASTDLGVTIN